MKISAFDISQFTEIISKPIRVKRRWSHKLLQTSRIFSKHQSTQYSVLPSIKIGTSSNNQQSVAASVFFQGVQKLIIQIYKLEKNDFSCCSKWSRRNKRKIWKIHLHFQKSLESCFWNLLFIHLLNNLFSFMTLLSATVSSGSES